MPMGAVMAFKGIEGSMVILHGSQGCSTYIRRHMAEHYNEPIDIASSSLNEQGTIYGGENNLKKGLRNIIKLYNPEIIGVATTCLAETIGEDIKRISEEFSVEEGLERNRIIPVSTPGYGGTQFEGYFAALTSVVKAMAGEARTNKKINIITPAINPGDVRNIKNLLDAFEIEYILLPDVSDTLDSPYSKEFKRIPEGGTRLEDIKEMSGAVATIEMGMSVPPGLSPGQYLLEKYNVPLYRCPLPIGLENTDCFLNLISKIAGKPIPLKFKKERGRFVDGMIDSHKYNGEGRAVIFGEPEIVYAVSKLCLENGIKPVLVCTGTQNTALKSLLKGADIEPPLIIDDTDFETIQKYSRELEANILIGNSDGKFISEKEGIPLVRVGFPIHDRVGGQRLAYTGYEGSMRLLDDITNTLLENKYSNYRKSMLERYYLKGAAGRPEPVDLSGPILFPLPSERASRAVVEQKTKTHPCFSGTACQNARMHIPVAPACNISCNYCNRKFDCVNESRPGVTSEILSPEEAAEKFAAVKRKLDNLVVVGIAGPGDALANFKNTKKSIELIRAIDENVTFCLSTNGLMLPHYADELVKLGVTHVTVTINTIDPKIGSKIYKEINYMGRTITGEDAAEILIKNQLKGLKYLVSANVACKVNIVAIKGINEGHIEAVAKKAKDCGAYITNIMPLIPAKGSAFEHMPLISNKELNEIRKRCEADIRQMYHCRQCRADAIGTLGEDCSAEFRDKACSGEYSKNVDPERGTSYVFAIASKTGMLIDQHFGHAEEFHIYKYQNSKISFVEKRKVRKYCGGVDDCEGEESKTERLTKALEGCNAVLVLRIGYRPSKMLEDRGIKVIQTCGSFEEGIRYALEELKKERRPIGTAAQ